MQRIPPDPAEIDYSAAELRSPRTMRSFETSTHVRSHGQPKPRTPRTRKKGST